MLEKRLINRGEYDSPEIYVVAEVFESSILDASIGMNDFSGDDSYDGFFTK